MCLAVSELLELLEDGFSAPGGVGSSSLGEHAAAALQNDLPGGCLDGFLRENAQLHVVLVAGEPDTSALSAEQQLADLRSMAPEASELRVSVLVPTSSEACSGVSLGAGYLELAAESEGAIEDLCVADWSSAFLAFSDVSIAGQIGEVVYSLVYEPLLESIQISAGGLEIEEWSWDSELQAIRFEESAPITPGEWVSVGYAAALDCEDEGGE